ncbi:hypothetical protein [Rugamonas rubra]|uniref:Uncharacterized protein n=1 Tax=Rugamonas rubra TaxID=758825 RepID=A0A1I4P3D2_9BURK|nr:hypothetical protein [Rugamonas rubra]SFM22278.1 hypothetical protein SAMN02982985_03241 [Rugamonas rubra]
MSPSRFLSRPAVPATASPRPGAARLLAVLAASAALLAGAPAAAQRPALGRLFSSPDERAALDAKRDGAAPAGQPAEPAAPGGAPGMPGMPAEPAPAQAAPAAPAPVQLNGVLRGSSGRATVWLDQQPQAGAGGPAQPGQAQTLQLSSGRRVVLKPGQSYNAANGSVVEAAGR